MKYLIPITVFSFLFGCALLQPVHAQKKMDGVDKSRVMTMLKNVKNAIKKDYYDEKFGGVDLEARFDKAEEKLKSAEYLGQAFSIIAQAVVDLNDSHTRFYPPSLSAITEYGWRMKMFGNKAFITAVKDDSDAAKKGLRAGDEVLKLNGFKPTRSEMWKMIYYYQTLSPQTKLTMELRRPSGDVRQVEVESKVTQLKRVVNLANHFDLNEALREGDKLRVADRHYFRTVGTAAVWKMPDFVFDPNEVESLVSKIRGRHTLILDLRGNGGGYVVTLEKLAGFFFDKDIKIADLKGRKPMKPQMAKTQGDKVFPGKVIVLVDSNSASAAEIFARLMQLEKRGIVLGDVSAGAVMQSRGVGFDAGVDTMVSYGMNLTNADVIMADGNSLEHVGVRPDEIIVPTGADLAELRDPVLARALEISGNPLDATSAGKLVPVEPFITRTTNIAIRLEF